MTNTTTSGAADLPEGAKKWIDSNFPNHNDPFAYWND